MSMFKVARGKIIKMYESPVDLKEKNIDVIPFYKWALEMST